MYAAIWIPQLALQAVLRSEAFSSSACVAILRETAQRSIIFQVNSFATHYGVMAGQTVSQAIAKCKDLQVRPRKPLTEKAARNTLFNCIYTLTPIIEETSEETYTLQLQGIAPSSLKLRIHELLEQLQQHGFSPRIGVAATPDWANYAAKCAQPMLWIDDTKTVFKDISIHTAVEDPKLRSILRQWGIRTLADFAKLSQQAIGERLGKAGLGVWRSLHNSQQRILQIKSPPVEFKSMMELEFEICTLEPLLFVLNRMLEELCLQLKSNFLKAQILILQLSLENRQHYRRVFKLPEPTLNRDKMKQVLHTHLENLQTHSSITVVSLEIVPTDASDHQTQIFQQQVKDPWKFASTLHQLIGLVGSENVGTPHLKDTHEPDAFSMEALPSSLEPLRDSKTRNLFSVHQVKLQRFRPPLSAKVQTHEGKPASLSTRQENPYFSGMISGLRGPWHLSGTWWDSRHWRRMEWDIQVESGSLLRLVYSNGKWFIEGAYG